MKVLEVIQRSSEFLAKKGVESPRLQTELLLSHVLRVPRLNLYLDFERKLSEADLESVRELVRRRGTREPLQHILGSASFCGLEIKVGRDVLVPRPETELLAERAWDFLSAWPSVHPIALDFGTGSGCVAVVLAAKCPAAQVHAVDVSAEALRVAQDNAVMNGVADKIRFHLGDAFAALPTGVLFALIVANPPYIPVAEIDTLAPEVRDYDPRLALDGGPDGLDFYRRLAREAAKYLEPAGRIMLEFGDGQADRIREIFADHNWVVERIEADYSGRPRILVASVKRV
ncbi:MAG TPA: peptide chain release factor N(5)-glutamine methyltransferase [Candidatus Angelobacter sp.]|nr:peptide chain release factor N(5)-glutamine methyltransferase [Candidatus Angelobacter sp.]